VYADGGRVSETSPQKVGARFFKELADFAPVMIWRSGPEALCDRFDDPWVDSVGRSMAPASEQVASS
jgi:hypothetical protein